MESNRLLHLATNHSSQSFVSQIRDEVKRFEYVSYRFHLKAGCKVPEHGNPTLLNQESP